LKHKHTLQSRLSEPNQSGCGLMSGLSSKFQGPSMTMNTSQLNGALPLHLGQQPHRAPPGLGVPGAGAGGVPHDHAGRLPSRQRACLSQFALLLASARDEGSFEPAAAARCDAEAASIFSCGHLRPRQHQHQHQPCMPPATPPSISSSSLSIRGGTGGGASRRWSDDLVDRKAEMLEAAATNMSAPFYTTPDTVSCTAKTLLKNTVATMEGLVDSRLRSTVSQLVRKAGGLDNSPLFFHLLKPKRNPVKVATVVSRFTVPGEAEGGNDEGRDGGGVLSIPVLFKATLDVKIFGEVNTIELGAPATMSGRFDPHDGLLTAVDISFDTQHLLKMMILQARSIVKVAVTKAAALSIQIADWSANKGKGLDVAGNNVASALSLHSLLNKRRSHVAGNKASVLSLQSLLGSIVSLNSLDNSKSSGMSGLLSMFPSLSSMRTAATGRDPNRGLGRGLIIHNPSNNANATFDLGDPVAGGGNHAYNQGSVVRFQTPGNDSREGSPGTCHTPKATNAVMDGPLPSCLAPPLSEPERPPPAPPAEEGPPQEKGNIHKGLFSWLQDDKMFLTDEKIKKQNKAKEEQEQKLREAPMPLRFFTAAEELGGGLSGLETVSQSIFGGGNKRSRVNDQGTQQQNKRAKVES
ncbi:hypothetical protein ACHAWF_014332, partial [Thalassiosira exigua]